MARGLADQHDFGFIAGLFAHPQRGHRRAPANSNDQIGPGRFEGVTTAEVKMIQGGTVARLAQYVLRPHMHVFVLHRPGQRIDDSLHLAVIALLVTEDNPGTRSHCQTSVPSWQ